MGTRREMLSRIRTCTRQGVPITNYGLVIAHALGILRRALEPFPEALAAYARARRAEAKPEFAPAAAESSTMVEFAKPS